MAVSSSANVTESNDDGGENPFQLLRQAFGEAGVSPTLFATLGLDDLDEPPETGAEMLRLLDGKLEQALIGVLHPKSVGHVLELVQEKLGGKPSSESGASESEEIEDSEIEPADSLAATVPPPSGGGAAAAYDDLVSGAIHSRVTPTWGLRILDPNAAPNTVVWAIVSNDSELQRVALSDAPRSVDVVAASSMAVLKGALGRVESGDSAVVLDAQDPSIAFDRAIACLTEHAMNVRVILWRMPHENRARLVEAIPQAYSWLPCEAEVTPREIIMLLGVSAG